MNYPLVAAIAYTAGQTIAKLLNDPNVSPSPQWNTLSDEAKSSVIQAVVSIHTGLIANPQQSHENWVRDKTIEGWKQGSPKSVTLKTHPDLVPWHDLPLTERMKNIFFYNYVRELLTFT